MVRAPIYLSTLRAWLNMKLHYLIVYSWNCLLKPRDSRNGSYS
jgi:hypothetical protein